MMNTQEFDIKFKADQKKLRGFIINRWIWFSLFILLYIFSFKFLWGFICKLPTGRVQEDARVLVFIIICIAVYSVILLIFFCIGLTLIINPYSVASEKTRDKLVNKLSADCTHMSIHLLVYQEHYIASDSWYVFKNTYGTMTDTGYSDYDKYILYFKNYLTFSINKKQYKRLKELSALDSKAILVVDVDSLEFIDKEYDCVQEAMKSELLKR